MEKFKNWGKKALKIGATAGLLFLANKSEGKIPETDSTILKNKTILEDSTRNNQIKKGGVAVYTESKTKEGGVTPTGYSNSFLKNEYGITVQDIDTVASIYGFRNDNTKNFQEDMIMYLLKNNPEKIDEVIKKFGQTEYGEKNNFNDYRLLLDEKFGRRMAYLMQFLKKENKKDVEEKIETKKDESISKIPETKEEGEVFKLEGFDKLYVLFDVSPSMRFNKDTLAKDLLKNKSSIPVEFDGFTNKIEYTRTVKNLEEASIILRNAELKDVDQEYGINVLMEKMEKMEKEGRKLVVVCTDEELQNVSKEELLKIKNLSLEKNTDIQFTIMLRGNIYNLDIDKLIQIYKENYEKKVQEDVKKYNKLIDLKEKYINEYKISLEKTFNKKEIKNIKENLKKEEKELLDLKTGLIRAKQVNIRNFDSVEESLVKK